METRVTDLVIKLSLLGLFVYWSLTLIAPFALVVIWAVILTVALYPVYAWLRARLGGQGWLAATILTLVGVIIIIGPAGALGLSLTEDAKAIVTHLEQGTLTVPAPPEGLRNVPLVGEKAYETWNLASTNLAAVLLPHRPALVHAGGVVLGKIAGIGGSLVLFAISVVIAGFLFGPGPRQAEKLRQVGRRVAAEQGAHFVDLAGATIRNVSRGVIGVALLQTLLVGALLTLFAVPGSGVLVFVVLILCVIQIGPILVLLPAIVWAWMTMDSLPALAFTALAVPIALIDNVLKPILMARGLSTPMLVILVGVIGGTLYLRADRVVPRSDRAGGVLRAARDLGRVRAANRVTASER